MAKKKEVDTSVAVETEKQPKVVRYKGSQLLRMSKYNSREARVCIKPNEHYSFEEADRLITNIMKKKG